MRLKRPSFNTSSCQKAAATCPMTVPAFVVKGGATARAFVIPIALSYHRGTLQSLTVPGARFSSGESLYVATSSSRRSSWSRRSSSWLIMFVRLFGTPGGEYAASGARYHLPSTSTIDC